MTNNLWFELFILLTERHSPDELIDDFIKIAFPDFNWLENMPSSNERSFVNTPHVQRQIGECRFKKRMPWACDYVGILHQKSKFDGLNRWTSEVTIGLGWPPVNLPPHLLRADEVDEEKFNLIKENISETLNLVQKAINLPVRFIPENEETLGHYAKIRIIPGDIFYPDNRFKSNPVLPHMLWTERLFEQEIFTGVRFTPIARSQVDGYFLPKSDNSIDMAVCNIWPYFEEKMFTSLITECLVRAMGLPDMSQYDAEAVIGHWNSLYDKKSKRKLFDGYGVNPQYGDRFLPLIRKGMNKEFEKQSKSERIQFVYENSPENKTFMHPRAYDLAILSILYCNSLKPGMSRLDVIDILTSSDFCFSKISGVN